VSTNHEAETHVATVYEPNAKPLAHGNIFSRRRYQEHRIFQRKDAGVTLLTFILAVLLLSLNAAVYMFIENQRNNQKRLAIIETRRTLTQQIEMILESPALFQRNLNEAEPALKAPILDCLNAGSPADCAADLGMNLRSGASATIRFAGPETDPAFFDHLGDQCSNADNRCTYRVTMQLQAACPPNTNPCPGLKIMQVGYRIEVIATTLGGMRPAENPTYNRYRIENNAGVMTTTLLD